MTWVALKQINERKAVSFHQISHIQLFSKLRLVDTSLISTLGVFLQLRIGLGSYHSMIGSTLCMANMSVCTHIYVNLKN